MNLTFIAGFFYIIFISTKTYCAKISCNKNTGQHQLFYSPRMKYQFYSYILLLILMAHIFRFQLPYLEYALLKPYIAKNLCENKDKPKSCCEGKCFREKQLKAANETSDTEETTKNTVPKTTQTKDVKEFLQTRTLVPTAHEVAIKHPILAKTVIDSRFVSAIFVPPQV